MRPTRTLLLLILVGFGAASLPVLVAGALWPAWVAWVGLVALIAGLDVVLALRPRDLGVELEAPGRLHVGARGEAVVRLHVRGRGALRHVGVLCELGERLHPQPILDTELEGGGSAEVRVALAAVRRGLGRIERTWVRWTGPLGLMQRRVVREHDLDIPIVPDIGAVRAAALAFVSRNELTTGARSIRFIGQGSEFDAMREYVPGLDHRAMSWKASARHRKLVCQEFRAERNRQVIVAIDTGHLMAEPIEGLPKLDHAIHTGLVLAYTCLRVGDRVGIFAFDETVRAFGAPRAGVRDFRRLQHISAGLDYSAAVTNFTLGIAELTNRLTRRSLVVILTDFVDTITAELMMENAGRLARRHLVVFVSFRDLQLGRTADQVPGSLDDLYRSVVAADFVRERDLVLRRLERLGIMTVDAPPGYVSADLLNRYLTIKRRELI
jgi:uncharacterized protein (DUF58 family)